MENPTMAELKRRRTKLFEDDLLLPGCNILDAFESVYGELSLHLPELDVEQRMTIADNIVRRIKRDALDERHGRYQLGSERH